MFDGLNSLNSLAYSRTINKVETTLKSIDGNKALTFEYDKNMVNALMNRVNVLRSVDLPPSSIGHLQLLDEYTSATIEGAHTTINNVLSGGTSKSDVMVRQCLAGLQYLLNNELTEKTFIDTWKIIVNDCCDNISVGIDGYRKGMVYVGNSTAIIHTPARPEQISSMIKSLFSYKYENDIINAAIYSYYTVYVHPFADGNGRLSRAIAQKIIGLPALPLSQAINCKLSRYYKALRESDAINNNELNITPYVKYFVNIVDDACDMFDLYMHPLDDKESLLLAKMDRQGKGFISKLKVTEILKCSMMEAEDIVDSLCNKGYFEYDEVAGSYKLIWR